MSCTTLYKLGSSAEEIGKTRNGFRSAMYVWNQIAKKYFLQDHFPMFDEELIGKIWNAHDNKKLTDDEIIVLASTMDKATVNNTGLLMLINAFESYGKEHENSSFSEQAEILKQINLSDKEYIVWQQTSYGEFWGEFDYDEEKEECIYYDPNNQDIHFDVIEQFNDIKSID